MTNIDEAAKKQPENKQQPVISLAKVSEPDFIVKPFMQMANSILTSNGLSVETLGFSFVDTKDFNAFRTMMTADKLTCTLNPIEIKSPAMPHKEAFCVRVKTFAKVQADRVCDIAKACNAIKYDGKLSNKLSEE